MEIASTLAAIMNLGMDVLGKDLDIIDLKKAGGYPFFRHEYRAGVLFIADRARAAFLP
jgi:hypothetical protein